MSKNQITKAREDRILDMIAFNDENGPFPSLASLARARGVDLHTINVDVRYLRNNPGLGYTVANLRNGPAADNVVQFIDNADKTTDAEDTTHKRGQIAQMKVTATRLATQISVSGFMLESGDKRKHATKAEKKAQIRMANVKSNLDVLILDLQDFMDSL